MRYLVCLVCLIATAACGSSKSPTAPAPIPAPVTSKIIEGADTVPSLFILYVPFTTTATGTIAATVNWGVPANDIDVYLARGNHPCSVDQFNARTCTFLGFSESTSAKPETVSVPNLAAGEYTLYVFNTGDADDTISYEVTLTSVPGTSAFFAPETVHAGPKATVHKVVPIK
jgi:hypothetical protein